MPPRHVQVMEVAFAGLLNPDIQLSETIIRQKQTELTDAYVEPYVPPGPKDL